MFKVSNLLASSASAVRFRRAGLAGSLAVLALLGACATPVGTTTTDASAPVAYLEYGTVRHIDIVEPEQAADGGSAAVGNDVKGKEAASNSSYYRVTVDLDSGGRRVVNIALLAGLEVGEHVRIQGDDVIPLIGM